MTLRRSLKSFYLRVKTREEGTPRYRIRRHVDLIDDHCHASCQMDFLLAVYVDSRSEVFSYPAVRSLSCSADVIFGVEDNTFARLYQMYLSARSTSEYCDHLRIFVELRSAGEIISRSALGKPGEPGSRQKLARKEAVNVSRYRSPWWSKIPSR